MTYTFKKSERYYKIGDLLMIEGMIDKNPFYDQLTLTKTGLWILYNAPYVQNKIKTELSKLNVSLGYGKTIEDIYQEILEFFIFNPDKDFQENYSEDENYTIEAYVLSSIKPLLQQLINKDDMNTKKYGFVLGITHEDETKPQTISNRYLEQEDHISYNLSYYLEVFEYVVVLIRDATGEELSPEFIYDYLFSTIENIDEESIIKCHRIKNMTKIKKDIANYEYKEDLMPLVKELATAVINYDFIRENIKNLEID